jgi:rare lipoprotein A
MRASRLLAAAGTVVICCASSASMRDHEISLNAVAPVVAHSAAEDPADAVNPATAGVKNSSAEAIGKADASPMGSLDSKTPRKFSGRVSFYKPDAADARGVGDLTAAHRTLPFGTKLRVTETAGGRSVVVTITDRGPFVKGRVLDVSRAAAEALGLIERGVAPCIAEII